MSDRINNKKKKSEKVFWKFLEKRYLFMMEKPNNKIIKNSKVCNKINSLKLAKIYEKRHQKKMTTITTKESINILI